MPNINMNERAKISVRKRQNIDFPNKIIILQRMQTLPAASIVQGIHVIWRLLQIIKMRPRFFN